MKKFELEKLFSQSTAAPVWEAFKIISSIPRCSTKEARIMEWIRTEAIKRGLKVVSDPAGNILVRLPGHNPSKPGIVLQAHTDMVCEQNEGHQHDFCSDPLELDSDGLWVFARGTTLGADNGIGVAMMMALLDQGQGEQQIDLLFTVDEERGLTGAKNLDPAMLDAEVLLNLDGEEEGTFYIGCAGGQETNGTSVIPLSPVSPELEASMLRVKGLKGGHSGADIHLQKGNGIKILGRLLDAMFRIPGLHSTPGILNMQGGDKHNAIPREARAVLLMDPRDIVSITKVLNDEETEIMLEFAGEEPEFQIQISPIETRKTALDGLDESGIPDGWMWSQDFAQTVVRLLLALPHGVDTMSRELPGLVSSSSNLASIRTRNGNFSVVCSQRGDRDSLRYNITASIEACLHLAGFKVESLEPYPAWPPAPDTPLVKSIAQAWNNQGYSPPVITSIHAGLECGVIGKKNPALSMVSFGPTIVGAHTPEEKASIASVERIWSFLLSFLGTRDKDASASC